MRFYPKQHQFYCGIDLHARSMSLCIHDQDGEIVLHRNLRAEPEPFLNAIASYRNDIVVAVECMFAWYWLADLDLIDHLDRLSATSNVTSFEMPESTIPMPSISCKPFTAAVPFSPSLFSMKFMI